MITIVTATGLEARAARKYAPAGVPVAQSGISLQQQRRFDDLAISCGLAGGLRADLPTRTVLIPSEVRRPNGSVLHCDTAAVEALRAAAKELGLIPCFDPLLTSDTLVHGDDRAKWSALGYAGVDMETGLLEAPRIACVRVILDTPKREISAAWTHPLAAILQPRAWFELPFLMREGPHCSEIAARIVSRGIQLLKER